MMFYLDSGCKFKKPHLIPLFLPFLALPDIRILYSGIVDVKSRKFIPTIQTNSIKRGFVDKNISWPQYNKHQMDLF